MGKEMLLDLQEHEMEATLTQRQKDFLNAYRREGSAAKAADALGCATDTAREQLRNVARKLGFTNIRDVVQSRQEKGAKATAKDLKKILESQEYLCALSGVALEVDDAQLDHIAPKSRGGTDACGNLQWVTSEVNRMKGNMTQAEFIAACKRIAEWSNTPPLG